MGIAAERIDRLHALARAAAADGEDERARSTSASPAGSPSETDCHFRERSSGSRVTGVMRISGREPTRVSDCKTATS